MSDFPPPHQVANGLDAWATWLHRRHDGGVMLDPLAQDLRRAASIIRDQVGALENAHAELARFRESRDYVVGWNDGYDTAAGEGADGS